MSDVICLFCHKNSVPVGRWSLPCDDCKKAELEKIKERTQQVAIHQRDPIAVVNPPHTRETDIFVDIRGREVPNPGYDLAHDPRGWRYTGKQPSPAVMILK